jgi:hypothetical protein
VPPPLLAVFGDRDAGDGEDLPHKDETSRRRTAGTLIAQKDLLHLFNRDTIAIIFAYDKMIFTGFLSRESDGRDLPP